MYTYARESDKSELYDGKSSRGRKKDLRHSSHLDGAIKFQRIFVWKVTEEG